MLYGITVSVIRCNNLFTAKFMFLQEDLDATWSHNNYFTLNYAIMEVEVTHSLILHFSNETISDMTFYNCLWQVQYDLQLLNIHYYLVEMQ